MLTPLAINYVTADCSTRNIPLMGLKKETTFTHHSPNIPFIEKLLLRIWC